MTTRPARSSDHETVAERTRALQLLRRIEREALFATPLLVAESGFVRALVLGVLRWRSRLDFVIATLAQRRIDRLDVPVVEALRVGIYQLMFMDVAPYAAVNETVEMTPKRARGFVNAIMRRASERELASIGNDIPAVRTAHPPWLLDRWTRAFGAERAERIAMANQELSYPDIVLPLSDLAPDGSPANQLDGVDYEPSTLVEGMARLHGSSAGIDAYAMDEGSAVIASMAASAGPEVLDLAAAPGGKSLFMRRLGAHVVSNDISLSRLRPLIARGGTALVSDGLAAPFRRRLEVVLLDAPCSATGTIRKNPELKWRLQESELATYAAVQKGLLAAALDLTERVCIYSTCSLEPEENDEVVRDVLAVNGQFTIVDPRELVPAGARGWIDGHVLRLTPDSGADGFTAFALRRNS